MGAPLIPFRPALRTEVLIEGSNLRDSLTGTVYELDEVARRLVTNLNVHQSIEDLVNAVARFYSTKTSLVEAKLRQILLLGMFEDTCNASRIRLRGVKNGGALRPHVLAGSRFACQNSGACCRGYVFGSINEQEKERIEALNPRQALPQLRDNPLFIEVGLTSGSPTYRLATVGDTCVFLEEGPRCGLHHAFGADAKPKLCQLYPLDAIATIDGLKIYDRGECATFAVSARTGTLLENDLPRIRGLVAEDIYHPTVHLHASWRCDYGLILELARRLDEEAQTNSPLQALHTIGHIARGFIVSVTRCPIEPGEPENSVSRTLGRSAIEFCPSESAITANAHNGLRTLIALSMGLAERVAPQEPLAPSFIDSTRLLSEICGGVLGECCISERTKAALAISLGTDIEGAMRLSLRQQLFGRELLLDDHLASGLLRMALTATLTLAGARLRAREAGEQRVLPSHFSASHMTAKRTLHRPEPHALLRANGEHAWPILDALPLLVRDLG